MGSTVLLDLMGGVALLLWGLHMVRSGIMRAFGSELRRVLNIGAAQSRPSAARRYRVTALLQSSTATGLLMTSFAARGSSRSRAGSGRHARCQCRHDIDRPGPFVQRISGRAGPVYRWIAGIQRWRAAPARGISGG